MNISSRIELQGFCSSKFGPYNDFLNTRKLLEALGGASIASGGMGPDQVRFMTSFSSSPEYLLAELREHELRVNSLLSESGLVYSSDRPNRFCMVGACLSTPLRKAVQRALLYPSEGGENGSGFVRMGDFCSTQLHFGFSEVVSQEGVLAYNLLTLVAPSVLEWVHDSYSLQKVGRNIALSKFARPERLPASRWFSDVTDFSAYFEGMPRLIKLSPASHIKKTYEVDLVKPQRLSDEASEGFMWTSARLRPSLNSVEFLGLPSLPPTTAVEFLVKVEQWLSQALESVGDRRFASMREAVSSGRIPPFVDLALPKNEEEWFSRWMKY